jgi:alkylhydroperoxidase/carboxymuconolactone decarboxylase family protein YurZ
MKKATSSGYKNRFERGMRVRKRTGRQYLMLNQKPLSPEMYEMSVGQLISDVWGRPKLSLRDRQPVTLGANFAIARPTGIHSHYLSATRHRITRKIIEVMIQVGYYTGRPTLSNAVRQFTEILEEDKECR